MRSQQARSQLRHGIATHEWKHCVERGFGAARVSILQVRHDRRVSKVIGGKPGFAATRLTDQIVADALNDREVPRVGCSQKLYRLSNAQWCVGTAQEIIDPPVKRLIY